MYCPVSFADFSYDIDSFMIVSDPDGDSTFIDEFDDDEEPPSGPSGPLTYNSECGFPLSQIAENGGLLNLNKSDACEVPDEFIFEIILNDSNFFINSGIGGSIEGNFRLTNGITPNSGIGLLIFAKDENGDRAGLEDLFMLISSDHQGKRGLGQN